MSTINPDLGPDPVRRLADGGQREHPMSRFELHGVFREAARWELSKGGLSGWRRRRLVKYAAALRISAVDAGRLIQEAAEAARSESSYRESDEPTPRVVAVEGHRWPSWPKLAIGLGIVAAVKLTLDWLLSG